MNIGVGVVDMRVLQHAEGDIAGAASDIENMLWAALIARCTRV
jgi:hypothetical protein